MNRNYIVLIICLLNTNIHAMQEKKVTKYENDAVIYYTMRLDSHNELHCSRNKNTGEVCTFERHFIDNGLSRCFDFPHLDKHKETFNELELKFSVQQKAAKTEKKEIDE